MPQAAAGRRMDPPVSDPTAPRARPAATATAEPLEEPPVQCPARHGFWACPWWALSPKGPIASSVMLSLPSVTAPAAASRATTVQSCSARKYSAVLVPQEVGSPRMKHRSLKASGTPWSGPRRAPRRGSASSRRAVASAPA